MLELILVRHGETDSNVRRTYCGWTDPDLNDKGLSQAIRASELIKGERPAAIYTSPLKRAHHTASIIGGAVIKGLRGEPNEEPREDLTVDPTSTIIIDERLKEQNFGQWEDLTYREITERHPEECALWGKDWMNYCVKDGESPALVYERISGFIREITDRHKSGVIMAVTHLGCIRMLLAHLLGMSLEGFWRFHTDNGSISRLVIDNGYAYLKSLNER